MWRGSFPAEKRNMGHINLQQENVTMSSGEYERLVGEALQADGHDKAINNVICKAAVIQHISCRCGVVLDQRTAHVLDTTEPETAPPVWVGCPRCAEKVENAYRDDGENIPKALLSAVWRRWDMNSVPFLELFKRENDDDDE
jgi:hypothetical protein